MREQGCRMTDEHALSLFARGAGDWLHGALKRNATCDCGACYLCAYNHFSTLRWRIQQLEAKLAECEGCANNLPTLNDRIRQLEAERDEWKRTASAQAQLHDDDCRRLEADYNTLGLKAVDLGQQLTAMRHERDEARRNSYPHMCRSDHEQIGHRSDSEMCPVCTAMGERDAAKNSVLGWIKENGPGGWIDNLRQERDSAIREVGEANRKLGLVEVERDLLRKTLIQVSEHMFSADYVKRGWLSKIIGTALRESEAMRSKGCRASSS